MIDIVATYFLVEHIGIVQLDCVNLLNDILLEVSVDGHDMLVDFGYGSLHVYCELLLGHVLLFEFFELGSIHDILISSILLIIL